MFLIIQSIRMTAQLAFPCGESKSCSPKKLCMKKGNHIDCALNFRDQYPARYFL